MQIINVPSGTYTLVLGDDILAMNTAKIYLQCQTSDGAINILLPRITDFTNSASLKNWWFNIFVNDIGGNASTNNIKITPNPADTINGSGAQIILASNGVCGNIQVTGQSSWEFTIGSSTSSSVDGFTKTFLVPLEATMFNGGMGVALGKLPLGYRFVNAVLVRESLWVGSGATTTVLLLVDTVSGSPLTKQSHDLTNPSALSLEDLISASTSINGGSIVLVDGLESISAIVSTDASPVTFVSGSSSLYIIARQLPSNPEQLIQ